MNCEYLAADSCARFVDGIKNFPRQMYARWCEGGFLLTRQLISGLPVTATPAVTQHESRAGFVTNLARASKGFLKIKKKGGCGWSMETGPSKRQQFIPSILRRPWATS
jgi:hypothetical protein